MFFRKNRYGEKCIKFTNTGYGKNLRAKGQSNLCVCVY